MDWVIDLSVSALADQVGACTVALQPLVLCPKLPVVSGTARVATGGKHVRELTTSFVDGFEQGRPSRGVAF